jgi:ankyrin repeat protein
MWAAYRGYDEVARLLIEAKAEIEFRECDDDYEGRTALMLGAEKGHVGVTCLLIAANAEVEACGR